MRFLLLLYIVFASSQAIFRLSDIGISDGIVQLSVEKGAKLYVVANDDQAMLEKIRITNNLETKTAFELSMLGTNADQTKTGWVIDGDVTISSTNTHLDAIHLTGFVYFTTHAQAQDDSFLVYSVDRTFVVTQNIDDLTAVFLNQNLGNTRIPPAYVPQKSSRITEFSTFRGSEISIYWDEPTESYKNQNSVDSAQKRIFSNPLKTDASHFFDNVEPFQIFNDVWYLRSKGEIRFQVEPKWEDPNGTSTTKVTTTGLLMSSGKPENLTISMRSNSANEALTGAVALYNVQSPVECSMDGWGIGLIPVSNTTINNRRASWSVSLSTSFQITSFGDQGGRYAVQYFQIEGAPLPTAALEPTTSSQSTTPKDSTTTTTTVPTTTRIASKNAYLLMIVVLIMF